VTDASVELLRELVAEVRGLREIRDELRGLRADLAARRLTPSNVDLLERLLAAIAGARGSVAFAARDLEDEHPELAPIIAGRSAKQLGRMFGEAEGVPIAGYIVQRAGLAVSTQLWEVLATPRAFD
jgi:hypothetical protein